MRTRRKLRCVRCGATWMPANALSSHPLSPAPVSAGPGVGEPLPPVRLTAMERLSSPAPPPARGVALILAWVATLAILIGAAAAVLIWREQIVQLWPPSVRLLGRG
jgi:hypothetical protein